MPETNWFHDLTTEDVKEARALLRDKVITCLAVIIGLGMALVSVGVMAEPMAQASSNGVTIVLYTEPCKLDAVVNLPNRATWQEGSKVYEGCFGLNQMGVVMLYFSDKSVAVAPMDMFVRVTGI